MAWKQFETLQGFRAKTSLVVNCCLTKLCAALLLGLTLREMKMFRLYI